MVQRVCVTGASGQAGRAVVRELGAHGYDVMATDVAVAREDLEGGMLRADLTDYGQALEVLQGAEASWEPAVPGAERALEALRGVSRRDLERQARMPSSIWRTSRRPRLPRPQSRSPRMSP